MPIKRRTLTKQQVVEKSAELVNASGEVEQLALKDVAAALDIRVPSLYNHVNGLSGLRLDLRLYALQQLLATLQTAMQAKMGQAALLAGCHAYREFAHANPGLYPLTLGAGMPQEGEEAAQLQTNMLTLLTLSLGSFGLDGDDALHAIRALRSLLHGFVSLELQGGFAMKLDLDESYRRLLASFVRSLSQPVGDA